MVRTILVTAALAAGSSALGQAAAPTRAGILVGAAVGVAHAA